MTKPAAIAAEPRSTRTTETEKFLHDIHELRESIEIDWEDPGSNPLREVERKELRRQLELCQAELEKLIERLRAVEDDTAK